MNLSVLKGFEPIERMDDGRLAKRIYRVEVDEVRGVRGSGRPERRRPEGIGVFA